MRYAWLSKLVLGGHWVVRKCTGSWVESMEQACQLRFRQRQTAHFLGIIDRQYSRI